MEYSHLTYRNRTVRNIFLNKEHAEECAKYFRETGHNKVRIYARSSGAEGIWIPLYVVVSDAKDADNI